ncbi:MAG: NAD(P)H-hydrate dehydratase [Pseudomonadota bacterium]
MPHEILSPDEMADVDRAAIEAGPFDGYRLMLNVGAAVAAEVLRRYPGTARFDVLCGPGNNGGDGYVVARLLAQAGCAVNVWAHGTPRAGSDAELAARDCPVEARPFGDYRPDPASVVVDALYGAGLARPLDAAFGPVFDAIESAGGTVVAVDLPSGLSGLTGRADGPCVKADVTVTFVRKKPGHLLEPGRSLCGEVVVADIGIADSSVGSRALNENLPVLWKAALPFPSSDTHKYARGHVAVFSGRPTATGAARLSAMAAARAGAGAVTVLSPPAALQVNAAHLTSVILRRIEGAADAVGFVAERKVRAAVLGPGFGDPGRLRETALALLDNASAPFTLVLDADAFTAFADAPASLFISAGASKARLVMTPHAGEFERLFGDIARDASLSKVEKARKAAERSHAVVVLKGPDTVVAAPDGRAVINSNGSPWLATAGSGDVLAGLVAGLTAQGMDPFAASCAAVWIHAEAGSRFGPGLIAEDLPTLLPPVLMELFARSGAR